MESSPNKPHTTSTSSGTSMHTKTTHKPRSKVMYFWRSEDVNKWLRKNCGQYHKLYGETFSFHDINGRSLLRLTESKLQLMGIEDPRHRDDLMRHILKLKLKTEENEFKTLSGEQDHIQIQK